MFLRHTGFFGEIWGSEKCSGHAFGMLGGPQGILWRSLEGPLGVSWEVLGHPWGPWEFPGSVPEALGVILKVWGDSRVSPGR